MGRFGFLTVKEAMKMFDFSKDLLQFTRNYLLTFIMVGFFLCGTEKSAILCSSLKCSSVAN